jgi:peptidoglycan/LPS O-acetylase OafA/YrhL
MARRTYVTLDGLRGVAALSIVVLHCYRYFGDMTWSSAALAVDLFFVLSGFVLAYAYEATLPSGSAAFLKARFIRLYPLYLVGTGLGVVEALLTLHYGQSSIDWTWHKFWTSLPFALAMVPAPDKTMFPFNGVMWSIFFELFINVVWAIFWKPLQSTRALVAVIVVCAVGLALSVAYWGTVSGLGASWPRFIGGVFRVAYSFFLGVLFFRIHQRVSVPSLPTWLLLIGLPAILFLPLPVFAELLVVLFVLPCFVLLGSRTEPKGVVAILSRKLGLASYAVYTVHNRLYRLTYAAALQLLAVDLQLYRPWVGILFMVLLVAGCLLLNRYYDAPARRWLTRLLSARLTNREQATQAP